MMSHTYGRANLVVPDRGDNPDGPTELQALAASLDPVLFCGFPCPSTARPSSPPDGFIIRETDTGAIRMWAAGSPGAWSGDLRGGGGTGGGGGTFDPGALAHTRYSASAAQTIANDTVRACAFGNTDQDDALISKGAVTIGGQIGHAFTFGAPCLAWLSASVRYAASGNVGSRYAGLHWYGGAHDGDPLKGVDPGTASEGAVSLALAESRYFAEGDSVYVQLYQNSGGPLNLEPGPDGEMGLGWVSLSIVAVAL
jgi:hypothetical protein